MNYIEKVPKELLQLIDSFGELSSHVRLQKTCKYILICTNNITHFTSWSYIINERTLESWETDVNMNAFKNIKSITLDFKPVFNIKKRADHIIEILHTWNSLLDKHNANIKSLIQGLHSVTIKNAGYVIYNCSKLQKLFMKYHHPALQVQVEYDERVIYNYATWLHANVIEHPILLPYVKYYPRVNNVGIKSAHKLLHTIPCYMIEIHNFHYTLNAGEFSNNTTTIKLVNCSMYTHVFESSLDNLIIVSNISVTDTYANIASHLSYFEFDPDVTLNNVEYHLQLCNVLPRNECHAYTPSTWNDLYYGTINCYSS